MATTKTIDIRTAIPGPRSQAILERKQRVIANAKSIVLPVVAHEGRGATLTDLAWMENIYSPPIGALFEPIAIAAQNGLSSLRQQAGAPA